jgi:hypothetical protein
MFFSMVTSGSFLLAGTAHGQCEVGVGDEGFSAQERIRRQGCDVLCAHHDLTLGIHRESAHASGHWTGEAQLARGIKKQ